MAYPDFPLPRYNELRKAAELHLLLLLLLASSGFPCPSTGKTSRPDAFNCTASLAPMWSLFSFG